MEEKAMQFGNFNVTFGRDDEPMLKQFKTIIFPALTSGIKRGNKNNENTVFLFKNVEVKEYDTAGLVLVGNVIKDFNHEIDSKLVNGELELVKEFHPEAPFSRFIVFLNNHRMILVRNGKGSPDIRSFGATLRSIVFQYIRNENKRRRAKGTPLLPQATINVVGIPLEGTIMSALSKVEIIRKLRLTLFPLNGENLYGGLMGSMQIAATNLLSKRQDVSFTRPESMQDAINLIKETAPVADVRVDVTYKNQSKGIIRDDNLTENIKVNTLGVLKDGEEDMNLIKVATEYEVITKTSDTNKKIYSEQVEVLKELVGKKK